MKKETERESVCRKFCKAQLLSSSTMMGLQRSKGPKVFVCVRACLRACLHACLRACVCVSVSPSSYQTIEAENFRVGNAGVKLFYALCSFIRM